MNELRENAVRNLLLSIGEDPEREGLQNTPCRVAKMYSELFCGYTQDPQNILGVMFTNEAIDLQEMVIVKDIGFYSHCEHHMVPFVGVVHIAYIPDKKFVGLSKLGRLVECFSRRLQVQERLTKQLVDEIEEALKPKGVAVVISAEHLCMTMRGVQKAGTKTVTSLVTGLFRTDPTIKASFYSML
ncbi:MAG: GTP cyclohydrolase I FolE [Negativicutes bacterium]|nr:GTP cyclohydrolase I FolE [Negativicutes bacterium]